MSATVAVLFARTDSVYKTLPDCDVWDIDRDARKWPGGAPVVAHPPCRAWGRLRQFARPRDDERDLALFAVEQVQKWGGALEHPSGSTLWPACNLPSAGKHDRFGGFTMPINQSCFGHRAEKRTLLYIVGVSPVDIPPYPLSLAEPTHVIGISGRRKDGTRAKSRPEVTKREREHTPPRLAEWLVELARRVAK